MTPTSPFRVVVAGGGIAGLEALLALKDLAGEWVEMTLLDPSDEFVYRPFAVAQPFGLGHAERISYDRIARDTGARHRRDGLAGVDEAAGVVRTSDGHELGYDALLVATGAVPVEGVEGVTTWWPGGDPEILGGLLRDLEEGYVTSVAFLVPSGYTWPLPIYEIALMAAREVAGMSQDDVAVTVVTPEAEPLALFGATASAALREELERAGVQLVVGTAPEVRRASGGVDIGPADGATRVHAQRALAVPRLVGPALAGLPADDEGFVLIEDDGRVAGFERVWAAGDGTASPVKLGGLATWQARRAAAAIAHLAGGDPERAAEDELVLEGVLMTGAEPRALDGTRQERGADRPVWRPVGKVAGRWVPRYVGDEQAPAGEDASSGVRVELRVSELATVDPGSLFDLSRPVHPNDPDLQRLGHRMHGQHGA